MRRLERPSIDEELFEVTTQEIELLDGVTGELDEQQVLAGEQMPVFFGSAMNNFGVQRMLERFLELAPPPAARQSGGEDVPPESAEFSGFVFKIQANMNPRHRDRAIFVRIVSGVFERDMQVINRRTGKKVRLANAQKLFGQDRETLDKAYAGDVLALVGNFDLLIGDTLSNDTSISYDEMPRFTPECFTYLLNNDTANTKRYRAGIDQLLKEGVAQAYEIPTSAQRVPLLGAVGPLQFEVLAARMESEYNCQCRLESAPWSVVQWVREKDPDPKQRSDAAPEIQLPSGAALARDLEGQWVVLLPAAYLVNLLQDRNEGFDFRSNPYD